MPQLLQGGRALPEPLDQALDAIPHLALELVRDEGPARIIHGKRLGIRNHAFNAEAIGAVPNGREAELREPSAGQRFEGVGDRAARTGRQHAIRSVLVGRKKNGGRDASAFGFQQGVADAQAQDRGINIGVALIAVLDEDHAALARAQGAWQHHVEGERTHGSVRHLENIIQRGAAGPITRPYVICADRQPAQIESGP